MDELDLFANEFDNGGADFENFGSFALGGSFDAHEQGLNASFSLNDIPEDKNAKPDSIPPVNDATDFVVPEMEELFPSMAMPETGVIDYGDDGLAIPQQGSSDGTDSPPKRKRGRPPGSKNKGKTKHPRTEQNEEAVADIYTIFAGSYNLLAQEIITQWVYHGEFVFKSAQQTFGMRLVQLENLTWILVPMGEPNVDPSSSSAAVPSRPTSYGVELPFVPGNKMTIDVSVPMDGQLYYMMRLPFTLVIEVTNYTRIEEGVLEIVNVESFQAEIRGALIEQVSAEGFHKKMGYASFMMRAIRFATLLGKQSYLKRQLATFLVSDLVQTEIVLGRLREGYDVSKCILYYSLMRSVADTIEGVDIDIRSLVSHAHSFVIQEVVSGFIPAAFSYSEQRPWQCGPDQLAEIKWCIDRFLLSKTLNTMESVLDDFKPLSSAASGSPDTDKTKAVALDEGHYYALPSLPSNISQYYRTNFVSARDVDEAYKTLKSIVYLDLYGPNSTQGEGYVFMPGEYSPTISTKSAIASRAVQDPFRYPAAGSKFSKLIEVLRFIWLHLIPKYELINANDRDATDIILNDREALTAQFGPELIRLLLVSEEDDILVGYSALIKLVRVLNTVVSHAFVVDYAPFAKNHRTTPFPITDDLKKFKIQDKDELELSITVFQYLYGTEPGFIHNYPAFYNPAGIPLTDENFKKKLTSTTGIGDKTKPPIALKIAKPESSLPHYSLEIIEYKEAARTVRSNPWYTQYLFGGLSKVLLDGKTTDAAVDIFDIPSNAFDIYSLLGSELKIMDSSRQNHSRFIVALGAQHRFAEAALIIYNNAIRTSDRTMGRASGKPTLGKEIVTMGPDGDADFIQCLRQMLYRGSFDRDGLLDMYYKRVIVGDTSADNKLAMTVVKLIAFTLALGNQLHPNIFNTRILPDLMRFVVEWSFTIDSGESLAGIVYQQLGTYFLPDLANVQVNAISTDKDPNLNGPLSLHVRNLSPGIEFVNSYQSALHNILHNVFDQQAMANGGPINFAEGSHEPTEIQLSWHSLMEKGAQDMVYGATVYEGLAFSMLQHSFQWLRYINTSKGFVDSDVPPSQRLAATKWRAFVSYDDQKMLQLNNAYARRIPRQDDDNEGFDLGDIAPLLNPEIDLTSGNRIIATNIIRNMGLYNFETDEETNLRLELLNDLMTQRVSRADFINLSKLIRLEITVAKKRNAHYTAIFAGPSWTTPEVGNLNDVPPSSPALTPQQEKDEDQEEEEEMDFEDLV